MKVAYRSLLIEKAYQPKIYRKMLGCFRDGMSENQLIHTFINRKEILKEASRIEKLQRILEKNKWCIISIYDEAYPKLLKEIYDPPLYFYYAGNRNLLKRESISIVGSRQAPERFLKKAYNLGYGLSRLGWMTISGLALGIDGAVHRGTLKGKGATLGVLGNGLLYHYPKAHWDLQEQVMTTGGLISEYPLHSPPYRWHFPRRNRLISGLSQGLIVVYSKSKGGSIISLDYALEEGRDVFSPSGLYDALGTETYSLKLLKSYLFSHLYK